MKINKKLPSSLDETGALFDRSFIARYDPNSGFRISVDGAQNLGSTKGVPFLNLTLIENLKNAEESSNFRSADSNETGLNLSSTNEKDERTRGVQYGPPFEEIRSFIKSEVSNEEVGDQDAKENIHQKELSEDDSRFVRKLDYNAGQKTPVWKDGFQVGGLTLIEKFL
jgi:hypothetical protein